MALRRFFSFIAFILLFVNSTEAQNTLEKELLNAYLSKDSSDVLFKEAYNKLNSKADTASYLYFKFFKKNALNEGDSAVFYSKKVIPLFHQLDTIERLRKIHERLYYLNLSNGDYENALKEILTALELSKKLQDTSLISLHYSDLAVLHHDFNFFHKGIQYGKKGFEIMNKAKKKEYKYLIFANNAIAINFDDWNKPDSALFYHYKNLDYLKNVKDTMRFDFIFNNIANTNLKQKKYKKAKEFLNRSLAINLITKRDYNLASNYTNLATIAYNENKNSDAEKYFIKATYHANKSNSIEKIRDVLEQESLFYKKNKNYKLALEKQDAFYTLKDSIFNSERSSEFAKLEVKYETLQKEKEIAIQKQELLDQELVLKNRNLYIILISASLLIILIISIGVYKRQQLKKQQLLKEIDLKDALAKIKTQNKLQEQRLEISRDLHDNIGSQLTFIISSIDNLKYVSKDINDKLKDKLSSISSFTFETIHQLRDTIWAMNKNQISFDEFQSRTMSYIEKVKTVKPELYFDVNTSISSEIIFSSVTGMNLFRVIQETINNAIKHADAKKVAITFKEKNDIIIMSVKDDGKGFDKENFIAGNGLSNIENRISSIGGKVFINSELGKGTIIDIQINKSAL